MAAARDRQNSAGGEQDLTSIEADFMVRGKLRSSRNYCHLDGAADKFSPPDSIERALIAL